MANIFKQLSEEHEEVRGLLESLKKKNDQNVFEEMRRNLLAHAKAEEAEFYSRVRSLDEELSTKIGEALQAHQEIEKLIKTLQEVIDDQEQFIELITELADDVEHHVEEEEGDIFPMVEGYLAEDDLVQMRDDYLEAKKAAMESIRPIDGEDRYSEMTKEELYEEAKKLDVAGRSQMTRDELEKELRNKGH